jgi:hypothetical protein
VVATLQVVSARNSALMLSRILPKLLLCVVGLLLFVLAATKHQLSSVWKSKQQMGLFRFANRA